MSRNEQYLYLLAAMLSLAPGVAEAAVVTRTTTLPATFNSVATTINFADVVDANELVSISAGSASTFEGGSFSISANYSTGSTVQIFSRAFASNNETYSLASVPTVAFTLGTLTGLTFRTFARDVPAQFGMLPAGTVFTFRTADAVPSAVPEPASWLAMVAGFGLIGSTLRARRRASPPQAC